MGCKTTKDKWLGVVERGEGEGEEAVKAAEERRYTPTYVGVEKGCTDELRCGSQGDVSPRAA